MARILVLNGPNLNLLGEREPDQYGQRSLDDILGEMQELAAACDLELAHFQSNSEGALVDAVQQAGRDGVDYIIINPAGYTHTSVALRDAFLAVDIPFIELHLSNTFAREEFRHNSYFSDIAQACLFGLGAYGYELAIHAASEYLANAEEE